MTIAFEKLVPPPGHSFRCFERSALETPAKWHRHPELEITFVPFGTGTRLVGDHVARYSPGDLVLSGENLPHTWLSDDFVGKKFDRHIAYVIQFSIDFLGATFFDAPELNDVRLMLNKARRGLLFKAETSQRVGEIMKGMPEQHGLPQLVSLLECLHLLAEEGGELLASEGYTPGFDNASDWRIDKACNYINEHLEDPELSHAAICKEVDMNPSSFSRMFKRATGRTVTQYVSELRIGIACRLLMETGDSILDVSLKSGFDNLSSFNRSFRKIKQMTPREYRSTFLEANKTAVPV